jgi:signal transduction histidine kinase
VTWLAVAFGAVVVVILAIAAFFLASVQDHQRRDLRDRYADRVEVAEALLDSLFRATFVGERTRLTDELGGARVDPEALDRQVRSGEEIWSAVVDSRGRVLGSSSLAPRTALGRVAEDETVQRAFGGRDYALGDIEDGTLTAATRFPAQSAAEGSRAYVSSLPPATLSRFLEGTLGPLPGVTGARAYIVDGNGAPVAGLARDRSAVPQQIDRLVRALDERPTGSFSSEGAKRFYASAPISRSRWRLVVTVTEAVLYDSVSGPSRWLPWVILALAAAALAGVAVLLRRLLVATRALGRSNAELEHSNAELARSNADLEQFAYVASHDLSEPLRTVAGFSQLLGHRYRGKLDAEADLYIDHMVAGVGRMQQLIDDLLLFSRVGRAPVGADPVDLDELLGEVLHSIEPAIREREAQITSGALPAVKGERGQLRQVLQNLVMNAMKFTAPDVTPEVHVSAARAGGTVTVSVEDNGIGVPPERREQVFKMFGRLHPADRYPGTGIGLALVQRIVERHGGKIWIEDGADGGSRFAFTLPAAAAAPRPAVPKEVPA